MVVVELENYDGETIGSVRISGDEVDIQLDGDLDLADIESDDIYGSDELKIRLQRTSRDDVKVDYRTFE